MTKSNPNPFPSESRDCQECGAVCTGIYVEADAPESAWDSLETTALIVCLECTHCDGSVLAVRHEGLWFCHRCWRREVSKWKKD